MKLTAAIVPAGMIAASLVAMTTADGVFPETNTTQTRRLRDDCGGSAKDVDLPGSDVGSAREAVVGKCWDRCFENSACAAWTWTNYEGGTCWLKSGYSTATYKAGAESGSLFSCTTPVNTKYFILANCDMPGNDLPSGGVRGHTYADCIAAVGAWDQSFTWSDYNGGTCWPKTKQSPCKYAPNKYTGIFFW